MQKSTDVVWHAHTISKKDRIASKDHRPAVIWLTGLPSSGKSTIANELEAKLFDQGFGTYVLDGDNIRHGLCSDLGFTAEDRAENIRRIGEVAKLFVEAGLIVITAFISPFKADRQAARNLVESNEFVEVHVKCPVEVCEERDPKGMYVKARKGEIREFTGVSSPYENPLYPEIVVETSKQSLDKCVQQIIDYLEKKEILRISKSSSE